MPTRPERSKCPESGVALITAVLAVTILMVIGVSFAFNMRLEEKAAVNYMNSVKASHIARAGLDKAIAALRAYANDYAFYCLTLFPEEFFSKEPLGRGTYCVTVIDTASRIYLNHDSGCGGAGNTTLDEMLDGLGISGLGPATADSIVNYREGLTPPLYLTKEAVMQAGGVSETIYNDNQLKDMITVHAWVNPATGRAPVNMNTASDTVFRAVLDPLPGIGSGTINSVVTAIKNRRPITTWSQFDAAIDGAGITTGRANTIKRNANPNRPSTYTTEFSFNSGGYFEIESTGRVDDLAGDLAAENKIRAVVNIFDIWQQTTEAAGVTSGFGDCIAEGLIISSPGDVNIDTQWDDDCDSIANWIVFGASVSTDERRQGAGSIELEAGEWAYKGFDPQTRLIAAAVWIYALDDIADGINLVLGDGATEAVDILMESNGTEFRYHDGFGYIQIGAATWNKEDWIEVQVVADVLANTFDVYIDTGGVTNATTAAGTGLNFRPAVAVNEINRITLRTIAPAVTCYFDFISINTAGPIYSVDTNDAEKPPGAEWGTIAWTESTPNNAYNRVLLGLSNHGIVWRGRGGAILTSLGTKPLRGNLDHPAFQDLYNISSGQAINPTHDAFDTLRYSAILAGLDAGFSAPTLQDVTITYLPETRILYWREVTE